MEDDNSDSVGIQDLDMPMTNIVKVLKEVVPEGTLFQKEYRQALSKACTMFISFITSSAHDVAKSKGHKMITANDVFKAFKDLDMEEYVEPLQNELAEYQRRIQKKKHAKSRKQTGDVSGGPVDDEDIVLSDSEAEDGMDVDAREGDDGDDDGDEETTSQQQDEPDAAVDEVEGPTHKKFRT